MAKKTVKARLEDIELKIGKQDDDLRIWISNGEITTCKLKDGTTLTMTQEEFDAKYPDAIKVRLPSDIDDRQWQYEGHQTQEKGAKNA